MPPDYADASHPEWVEASRWVCRQQELYRRQKLLLSRVRLVKNVLGEYSVPPGPCWGDGDKGSTTLLTPGDVGPRWPAWLSVACGLLQV